MKRINDWEKIKLHSTPKSTATQKYENKTREKQGKTRTKKKENQI